MHDSGAPNLAQRLEARGVLGRSGLSPNPNPWAFRAMLHDPSPPRPSAKAFVVPPELDRTRLDRCLAALVPETSRMHLQELIRNGCVRVDGVVAERPGTSVSAGAQLELELRPRTTPRVEDPSKLDLKVVFEDEHLAVIDKPPGMLTHPSSVVRGATVSELAVRRFGPLPSMQGVDRPGIVHRLDGGTSGLLVLGRTAPALESLMRQFRERRVEKTYLALAYGEPRFDGGSIDTPLVRSERHPERMEVAAPGAGRDAVTRYEVRERFSGLALIACMPKTGRTHQIRVHLASIGHPLVGDPLYRRRGGPLVRFPADAPRLERQALHAAVLAFDHPTSGERLVFEAPPPADFEALLGWLRVERPVTP